LHIDYPNEKDREFARRRGRSPGGDIYIHGAPNKYRNENPYFFKGRDWTKGCIALTNKEIEEVARLVPNGTTIYILP
jgi:murein L,D-transpeptidase YafK